MTLGIQRIRPADQVMWPLMPMAGESLLGFAARTAHHNVLPSGYTILRRAGHTDLQRSYASVMGDVNVTTIARALGVSEDEIVARRLPPSARPGFVLFHGEPVRRQDVVTHLRRFAPSRLRADALHVASSMLKTLPFCSLTWEYLRDACTVCGRVQGWRMARDLRRCDECGDRLADQGSRSVPEHMRPALATVAGVLDPDPAVRHAALAELPTNLSHLSGGEAFELSLTVLYIAHPDLSIDRPIALDPVDQETYTEALAGVARLLADFPHSLLKAFTKELSSAKQLCTAAHKRFTRAMAGKMRTGHIPAVTAIISDAIAHLPNDDDPCIAGHSDAAESALGRSYNVIAPARRDGVLKQHLVYTEGRFRLRFDRQELDELGRIHEDRIGVELAAFDLLLPMYAIPQLAAYGLLTVHSHPWWYDQFGMDQTTNAAVAAFNSRLRKKAAPAGTVHDPIQLSWAMRAFGGGPKPWGAALDALLEGGVTFELTGPEKTNYIVISRADVGRCCLNVQGTGLEEYSQRDALDVLNLNLRNAPVLAGVARIGLGRTAWRLPADVLMTIARDCVTAAELSARTGLHANVVARKLRALDAPTGFIGWERSAAETALSDYLADSIGGRLLATSE